MQKQEGIDLTPGIAIRLLGGLMITAALPFFITNPTNIFADIAISIGGTLLVIGGHMR